MSLTPKLPITVGPVIHIAEPDYCYGRGDLILRVCEIGTIQQHEDEPWLTLRGIQLRSNGADICERFALVRVAALGSPSRSAAPQDEAS